MKFHKILIIFLFLFGLQIHAQQDTIKVELKALKDVPKEKLKKDEFGNIYYYDERQRARIYEINGEKVVVMDELILLPKPHFNNDLDRNFYFFLNKKLYRVYPLFLTALDQYREITAKANSLKGEEKREFIRTKYAELADQYEAQLRDLTTTEGRVFAKLMHRATGKTVYEIIKELRGGWSAFWWNVKGNIADIELKKPYDPYRNREDEFVESLLQSNWNLGYLEPYEGFKNFKIKK